MLKGRLVEACEAMCLKAQARGTQLKSKQRELPDELMVLK
jgi:hypothetical protein